LEDDPNVIKYKTQDAFTDLFVAAVEKCVKKETHALLRAITKHEKDDQKDNMRKWVEEFYEKHEPMVKSELGRVSASYSVACNTSNSADRCIRDYISKNKGQILGILDDTSLEHPWDTLVQRIHQWKETKPQEVVEQEINGGQNE
jgi:hypothetical protein